MNREQNKRIAAKAVTLLGTEPPITEKQIIPYVAESVQRILNFCNREDLPLQLEYTAARAAAVMFNSTDTTAAGEQLKPSGNVTEYTEADATVRFDSSNSKAVAALNDFLMDIKTELYRWRVITFD